MSGNNLPVGNENSTAILHKMAVWH